MEIEITPDAAQQIEDLPKGIHRRVMDVFDRLRRWPEVSGAKPMRYELKGSFRIRSGDWRVLFKVDLPRNLIVVFRVDNRRDVYE